MGKSLVSEANIPGWAGTRVRGAGRGGRSAALFMVLEFCASRFLFVCFRFLLSFRKENGVWNQPHWLTVISLI